MPSLRFVPYGPQASAALRDAIVDAKVGDPLAPVTVAVPSNYAGLSLRRRLGSGELRVGPREGLVNVRFLVLARVAELLGAPALAAQGRRPLTGPLRAEAIRASLAGDPGVFRDVVDHTATERTLEATFRELRQSPTEALDTLAGRSRRAADIIRLYREVRTRTAAYYDEEDLADAAAGAVRGGSPALRDVGHVIVHLPRRFSNAEQRLLDALASVGLLTVIFGRTGDDEADEIARQLAERVEPGAAAALTDDAPPLPTGSSIVAVTDAEEEVRTAIRLIMERVAEGTPLHRIALLYPIVQPYALLAHEQFHAAGVPHNGPSVRTLAQTVAGRTLLGLLRLRELDYRRDALMDWLNAARVVERTDGGTVPAHRWDVLSRSAGVVGGEVQWRQRIERRRRSLEGRRRAIDAPDKGEEWERRRLDADIEQLQRLERFMDDLMRRLDRRGRAGWPEFAGWARGLLDRYLGGEGWRRDWPDDEIEAHRDIETVLEALGALGELRAETDLATFRRALERELEAPAARIGRFGEGVFIGRVRDAVGTDFDLAIVIGMTEGVMPSRTRDDPLLPDAERLAAGHDVPLRARRQREERRDYLAMLACAPERILVFPRADLRGQRGHLPARWLLESASALEGRTVFSSDFERMSPRPWYRVVPSFQAALQDGLEPASQQEYDLRSLLRAQAAGRRVDAHELVAASRPLRDGIVAERTRRGVELTRWDGRLSGAVDLVPAADRPVSPTALQAWAACPFRYFLGHVLRVAETERPEDTLTLSPLERGSLVHRALETFVREQPPRATPDQPWSDEERARLLEIGEQLCDEAEAAGLTGRPLLWRLGRDRILRDLASFLDADEALRREHGVVPVDTELGFGLRDTTEPPLVVEIDGRAVAFRGRIDRVDRAPDGSRLLVLDYKTGSPAYYRGLQQDPVQHGTVLQLPVYALAAQQRHGAAHVEAYYWFATEEAGHRTIGYPLSDGESRFRDAIGVITSGIADGAFPARPGRRSDQSFENCRICPYDRICPRNRDANWRRKQLDRSLRAYVRLAEG